MKNKRWSELTTKELAAATKEFDDPAYVAAVRKAPKGELDTLHRVQKKAKNNLRISLALDRKLIEQADDYAATHGVTFSEVVSDALRKFILKKSA